MNKEAVAGPRARRAYRWNAEPIWDVDWFKELKNEDGSAMYVKGETLCPDCCVAPGLHHLYCCDQATCNVHDQQLLSHLCGCYTDYTR